MPTDVVMPQMGESVAEGTIVRWIKKVGESIDRDEPLFEISTDKVDAEIPSPGEGVLLEIRVQEGETVPVNSIVAVIGEAGAAATAKPATAAKPAAAAAPPTVPAHPKPIEVPAAPAAVVPAESNGRRLRSSPLVRKIAKEHGVDISKIDGTGLAGRVSKRDILAYMESGAEARRPSPAPPRSDFKQGEDVRIEKMSVMRKKIAEHMVASVRTSPHVYSVFEIDFHRVEQLRLKKKADYERAGARLTFTTFIAKATIDAITECPFANASIDGDAIAYKREINLGIAVALDAGLIVPVIRDAASRSMLDLSRMIQDLAQRARSKQLKNDEVQGGTFTITNPGVFGAAFGLPIISQPQVAILAVGAIEKRVAVVDDMIAIRPMAYVSLGHDHRLIDGADAGRFLRAVKDRLERFDESWL
jgi:2-oxoglutarate dehydrogenase E2 component (dihydrolipoamide succinyltransferase)